jgi:hypothetical protein
MNLDEFKQKNRPVTPLSGPPGKDTPPTRPYPSYSDLLPTGYLINGYFDEKGNILPEAVIEWPLDIANKLAKTNIKASQLRNFFNEARAIQGQINAGKEFESVRGRILQFDAYAANALKKNNVPLLFKLFIEHNLKWAAKDKKSFISGFVFHYEKVIAYFPRTKD